MLKHEGRADGFPHPANFPIGSRESRATARALAERRDKADEQLVWHVKFIGGQDIPEKRHSYRFVNGDGKAVEWVIIEPDCATPEHERYRVRAGLSALARNLVGTSLGNDRRPEQGANRIPRKPVPHEL